MESAAEQCWEAVGSTGGHSQQNTATFTLAAEGKGLLPLPALRQTCGEGMQAYGANRGLPLEKLSLHMRLWRMTVRSGATFHLFQSPGHELPQWQRP